MPTSPTIAEMDQWAAEYRAEVHASTYAIPEEFAALVDAADDATNNDKGPTDAEILDMMFEQFGLGYGEAIARLKAMPFDELQERLTETT